MNAMLRIVAALAMLAATLGAQSPRTLAIEGQALPGGGTVTGIRFVYLDTWDGWLVQVTTDDPLVPSAVLRQSSSYPTGPIWKQVGDPVFVPAGAQISGFDSFSTELFGGVCWNARLRNTPGGAADDQALYFENMLWIQKGTIAPWPSTDYPAGSVWLSFDDLRCSPMSGEVLLRGRSDDPTFPGADETFVAAGGLCGSVGILCDLKRLAQEGWLAPGTGQLIESIRLAPGAAAVAAMSGRFIWSCDLEGPTQMDGCVYSYTHMGGNVLLAQEGTPSPVPGRRWGPLDDPGVHVNSASDWTLRATLDWVDLASDAIIVKTGQVLAREGDTLPDIAPHTFESFGRGQALLDISSHVVWFGQWVEHGQPSKGLFRDDGLLVRTGQTTVDGLLLVDLGSGPDDLALSPQGDRVLFKGTLENGLEGAFVLDLP